MDHEGSSSSTRHNVLERLLIDASAEPVDLPLSLLKDITQDFSKDREIGRGGFAVVYKGVVENGRMVAVKLLFTSAVMDENKFHREVECLVKAKHKNIVRFLGYCADTQGQIAVHEGRVIMAEVRNWLLCFEYVPNGSLDEYIADASHGLGWRERYQIINGICDGVNYLHKKRILHLDLKPANILVDDHMVPKIADFGLSRCFDAEQTHASTSQMFGSLGYFAPELYDGKITFAADIYSLGVIIFEILTGKKGYSKDENVVENWMNRLETSKEDTQLEQVRVCTKIGIDCMDRDPEKRPVAGDIIDRLDKTKGTDCCGETSMSSSSSEEEKDKYYARNGCPILDRLDKTKGTISLSSSEAEEDKYYARNGGHIIERLTCIKIFRKKELDPILKSSNFIGRGGFDEVYRGILDNELVAVRKPFRGRVKNKEEFADEIIIQSCLIHKNIIRLIGCCLDMDIPVLVYEFLSNGSLHDILHGNHKAPLNLDARLRIAAGSADGLAYMHSGACMKVLIGGVKTGNILLDNHFQPKIESILKERFIERDDYEISIIGDRSYMDPLYLQTGQLIDASDVYSFGVVILELITGKKATCSLVRDFLEDYKQSTLTELFDKEIAVTENDLEVLHTLAKIAVPCLSHCVDKRPSMVEVAQSLFHVLMYRSSRS